MKVQTIEPKGVHSTRHLAYSQAVILGDYLFVAGQVPCNLDGEVVGHGDIEVQTRQVFENFRKLLEESGSSLELVGKVTVFITDIEYRATVHRIRTEVFAECGHLPASTLAVVTRLANPDWLVEMDGIAALKG